MADIITTAWRPTKAEEEAQKKLYTNLTYMRDLKLETRPHFAGLDGQRSWLDNIDDSEKVLNGYQLSREDQGKESWQSNLLDNITLAKCRAIAAGVGLQVPDMEFVARDREGIRSVRRADIFKNITRQTFHDGNPMLHTFLQVWQLIAHGTLFEYEGYKTGGAKVRKVKSFDSVTGKIDIEEKYIRFEGKPFSAILNPQEFYWWDFDIRDIQDQPRLAWVQHYNRKFLEDEFSKYPNFKFVMDKRNSNHLDFNDTLYYKGWADRVEDEDDFEVVRLYDKTEDSYEVWANGIPLLRAPLLWGGDKKRYPFAKTVNHPFANTNFFVGMSWPAVLESYQDAKNTQINTLIDKTYRSMEAPMLVGLGNKDLFDVSDQFVNQDNRYYVPDINQVTPYPVGNVNPGELEMLNVINEGIELMSVDASQQGVDTGGDKTARQVLVEDARAQELKGSLYLALEDHWLQKARIRTEVVLTHFLKDKAAQTDKRDQIISIKDYTFGDGERGTLDIHVAKGKGSRLTLREIEQREQAMEEQGEAYKLVSLPQNYLNEWEYDVEIIPKSFHNKNRLAEEDELASEIQYFGVLAPEFLAANKEHYIRKKLELDGKRIEDFNQPEEQPQQQGSLLGLEEGENGVTQSATPSTEGGI